MFHVGSPKSVPSRALVAQWASPCSRFGKSGGWLKWGFPKIRDILLGVPIIRIKVVGDLFFRSPYLWKLPHVGRL